MCKINISPGSCLDNQLGKLFILMFVLKQQILTAYA